MTEMWFIKALAIMIGLSAMSFGWEAIKDSIHPRLKEAILWICVLPAAIAAAWAIIWVFEPGILWPAFAYPAFVVGGLITSPRKSTIVGTALCTVVVLVAAVHVSNAWKGGKTRRWMAAGVGVIASIGCVIYSEKYRNH